MEDEIGDNWDDPADGATYSLNKFWYSNSAGISVDGWRLRLANLTDTVIEATIATPFTSNPTDSVQVNAGDFTASITGAP